MKTLTANQIDKQKRKTALDKLAALVAEHPELKMGLNPGTLFEVEIRIAMGDTK